MSYSSTQIANNLLTRSFAEKRPLNSMKLQRMLYFVASEYQKATGRPLLEERFATWAYGPVLCSVHDQFRGFNSEPVNRLARDAYGRSFVVDATQDIELSIALDRVWHLTKNRDAVHLSEIARLPDSAWDKAFQSGSPVLALEHIVGDSTYRKPLGFAPNDI